jgi:hypothetical protein
MSYQVHVATVGAHISQNQPREEDRLDALRQIFNAFIPFRNLVRSERTSPVNR